MELYIFKDYKNRTRIAMENSLKLSQHFNIPLQPYTETTEYTYIKVLKEHTAEQVSARMETIAELLQDDPRAKVRMEPIKVTENCHTTFKGVEYTIKTPILRTHITETQVEDVMKGYVKTLLGLSQWDYLNCQVMALYKQDKITWAEAKQAHQEECKL